MIFANYVFYFLFPKKHLTNGIFLLGIQYLTIFKDFIVFKAPISIESVMS